MSTPGKKCARADCTETEFRIDGYCSIYCRDIDELEDEKDAEIAALKATLDLSAKANNALALKIGRLVEAGDRLADCITNDLTWMSKADGVRYNGVIEDARVGIFTDKPLAAWTAAKDHVHRANKTTDGEGRWLCDECGDLAYPEKGEKEEE